MSEPLSYEFQSESATVAIAPAAGHLAATFSGAIDDLRPDAFLEPIFARLHQSAVAHGGDVVIDLTALAFLNSNGIKCLANFVRRHMAMPEGERYPLKVRYTEAMTWQRATVKAIGTMARGILQVEAVRA